MRIGVRASGINFPDILMVEGNTRSDPSCLSFPVWRSPASCLNAQPVCEHVRPGDRVLAFARRGGGHAEEVVVPGAIVTPIPDAMDFVSAAAFPVAYGTAHLALTHRGHLAAGETLLVLGAAGGVGLAAIEVGKLLGARVFAAAEDPEKLAIARAARRRRDNQLRCRDLRDEVRALTDGKGVDVVFDPVGGGAFEQSVRCMGWEGRILVVGFAGG